MTTAAEVLRQAKDDVRAVEARLRAHPYVAAVEAGEVPRESLRSFAGEQRHIISSDLRSVAHLVARFGGAEAGAFFLDVLAGERAALDAIAPLARSLGATDGDLRAYEPMAGAHAYTCYMAWLALYGSPAEIAAAYVVNFPAWGEICGRLSQALQARYGLGPDDVAFFDLFASPPAGFEASATAVVQAGLDAGAEPGLVRRSVRLLQAYELMYWDTLYDAVKSKR